MGLIKAIAGAVGGTMKDQWLDLIKCDDMGMDTLMVKQTAKSNQISKGSRILVAPGQAIVIYDSGAILDASAEEGVYTFDQSSSPSFFGGQFGPVFKEMWQRFTYGGTPAKEQAIFFFNIKEIMGNKFGTATPIPFQDWSHPVRNEFGEKDALYLDIRCYGNYTFRLDDLALFMRQYAGTGNVVKKDEIIEQMRSEVISVLEGVVNSLGDEQRARVRRANPQERHPHRRLQHRIRHAYAREPGVPETIPDRWLEQPVERQRPRHHARRCRERSWRRCWLHGRRHGWHGLWRSRQHDG